MQLVPFPGTRVPEQFQISASVHWTGLFLSLEFTLKNSAHVSGLDAPASSVRRDGLWEHTCFETFFSAASPAYYEINLSPAGDWTVYRFCAERSGQCCALLPPPEFSRSPDVFRARFDFSSVPELAGRDISYAVTAVIEDRGGERTYWARQHFGKKPDFHSPKNLTDSLKGHA